MGTSSAILHGTVDPNGSQTNYSFHWGLTKAYGSSSPLKSAGSANGNVSVQTKAAGLLPGTTYHYRLVASSKAGATNGDDRTFRPAAIPHPPRSPARSPRSAAAARH